MDGEWSAPLIKNPKCQTGKCGLWKRPTIRNPLYKGKWYAPKIPNPKYKGEFVPKQIPNPNFFEDLHPHNFGKIAAVGFEIWTMQDNILFDNIFIGDSEIEASTLTAKFQSKNAKEKALQGESVKENEPSETTTVQKISENILGFVNMMVEGDYTLAIQSYPGVFTTILAAFFSSIVLFFVVLQCLSKNNTAEVISEEAEAKLVAETIEKMLDETNEKEFDSKENETSNVKQVNQSKGDKEFE
jgi:calnexin